MGFIGGFFVYDSKCMSLGDGRFEAVITRFEFISKRDLRDVQFCV